MHDEHKKSNCMASEHNLRRQKGVEYRIQIQENFPLSQVYVLGNINIAICLYEHQGN